MEHEPRGGKGKQNEAKQQGAKESERKNQQEEVSGYEGTSWHEGGPPPGEDVKASRLRDLPHMATQGAASSLSPSFQIRVVAYRILAHVAYLPWNEVVQAVRQWLVLHPLLNWWGRADLRDREKRHPETVRLFLSQAGQLPGGWEDDASHFIGGCSHLYIFKEHATLIEWQNNYDPAPKREVRDLRSLPHYVEGCLLWAHWVLLHAYLAQGGDAPFSCSPEGDRTGSAQLWRRGVLRILVNLFELEGPGERDWQYLCVLLARRLLPDVLERMLPLPVLYIHSYVSSILEYPDPYLRLLPRLLPAYAKCSEEQETKASACRAACAHTFRALGNRFQEWGQSIEAWWRSRRDGREQPLLSSYSRVETSEQEAEENSCGEDLDFTTRSALVHLLQAIVHGWTSSKQRVLFRQARLPYTIC